MFGARRNAESVELDSQVMTGQMNKFETPDITPELAAVLTVLVTV